MELSLEHQIALLPPDQQSAVLDGLDADKLLYDWRFMGRPSQFLPTLPGEDNLDWKIALALAGRGWGKTLTGAQWIRELDVHWKTLKRDSHHMRFALLGRTAADVRDVMLEGPSGILRIYPPSVQNRVHWIPSRRRLELPNGAVGICFSAEEPDQLRGPAFHIGWCVAEGTAVRTAGGELPIEAIEVGDRVWTRGGLRTVVKAGMTGVKEVMLLRTEDGRELRATGAHKIWTNRGWQFMRDVVPTDIVYAWTTPLLDLQHSSSGTVSSGTGMPRTATTGIPAEACCCTSPSGYMPTGAFRRGTTSTTLTTTAATTTSRTWKSGPRLITRSGTPGSGSRTTRRGLSRLNLRLHEHGQTGCGPTDGRELLSVSGAVSSSSPSGCGHDSVAPSVLQPLAVRSVENCSTPVRTYDLTVDGESEYFAGDLLVHNSDELASYKQVRTAEGELTAWDNLRIAVRLGEHPQVLATTTPKRVPLLRQLIKEADEPNSGFRLIRGKTVDNVKLSQPYRETLFNLYGGTKLGAQELEGEMLADVAGAMVAESTIDANRVNTVPFGIPWIRVIGVDPSVAEKPHDECGMVVVYASRTWPIIGRHAFVMDDVSIQASPAVWADRLIQVANEHQAVVVVEINQGHNLVTQLLRQAAVKNGLPMPPVRPVWSAKSKSVRSEIIGAAYERGRIHHLNVLADLESQQTSWVAGESGYSPDRMDALVHACAATLFPEALVHGSPGSGTLRTPGNATIPVRHQVTQSRRAG